MTMKQIVTAHTQDKMQDNGLGGQTSHKFSEEWKCPHACSGEFGDKAAVLKLQNPIGFLIKEIQGDGEHSI